jgi:uncharacterized membrane protein YciS (DUF1049 family)
VATSKSNIDTCEGIATGEQSSCSQWASYEGRVVGGGSITLDHSTANVPSLGTVYVLFCLLDSVGAPDEVQLDYRVFGQSSAWLIALISVMAVVFAFGVVLVSILFLRRRREIKAKRRAVEQSERPLIAPISRFGPIQSAPLIPRQP